MGRLCVLYRASVFGKAALRAALRRISAPRSNNRCVAFPPSPQMRTNGNRCQRRPVETPISASPSPASDARATMYSSKITARSS